jgi:hypothetical protein
MKGRRDVVNFVSGLSTRVETVNILWTAVDFPTAGGVWQMTTTKGLQYTAFHLWNVQPVCHSEMRWSPAWRAARPS